MRASYRLGALVLGAFLISGGASADPFDAVRRDGPALTQDGPLVTGSGSVSRDEATGSAATGCVVFDMVPNVAGSDCEFTGVSGNTAELARGGCFIQFDVMLSNFACAGAITVWQASAGLLGFLPAGLSRGTPPSCTTDADCESIGWCPAGSVKCCLLGSGCSFVFIDQLRPDGTMFDLPACGIGGGSILCGGAAIQAPPLVDNGQSVYLMSIKLFVEPGVVGTISLPFANPGIETFLIDVNNVTHTIGKPNPGVVEILPGQCCNLALAGGCVDGVFKDECNAQFPDNSFVPGNTCADACPQVTFGACCDRTPFAGGCRENVAEQDCAGGNEAFFPGDVCAQISCLDNPIPTVSEWGLVVMALLLLTGAKVYYNVGWHRNRRTTREC